MVFHIVAFGISRHSSWGYSKPGSKTTATTVSAAPSADGEYRAEGVHFSVIAPAPLVEKKIRTKSILGEMIISLFSVHHGNIEYTVMCLPDMTPSNLRFLRRLSQDRPNVEFVLDATRDRLIEKLNGKLINESKIMLDGIAGREVVIEPNGDIEKGNAVRLRMFMITKKYYQTMATGPIDELTSSDVNDFFESFRPIESAAKAR